MYLLRVVEGYLPRCGISKDVEESYGRELAKLWNLFSMFIRKVIMLLTA